MLEIIKTLLVSLSFAATGAGIAWSVTSDASEPVTQIIVGSGSYQGTKGDRLDIPSNKADRLPIKGAVIINGAGKTSSIVPGAPLAVASAH